MVSGVPADFEACRAPELADRAGAPVLRSSFNPARDSSPEMLLARRRAFARRRSARSLDGSASSVELGAPASKGHEGPFASPALRSARRLAVRATGRQCKRKSKRAVTRDIPDRFVATCASDRLVDTRDLPILMVAFASGDRRRSKVGRLRFEQLQEEPPVPVDPADPDSTPLPYLVICLGRTRMTSADDEAKVFLVVAPVAVVKEWLQRADIPKGPTFRAVDRLGSVGDRALTPSRST